MTIKEIENNWKSNFKRSALVSNGKFDSKMAYQLYHGFKDDSETDFKQGFRTFYECFEFNDENEVDKLLQYFHYIGINLSKSALSESINKGEVSYSLILKKAYYIFHHLSRYDESLDINDPFYNNIGDVLVLLKIENSINTVDIQMSVFDEVELPDFFNKFVELPVNYENDNIVNQYFNLIEQNNDSFFITGKAGTGKSTFIRYFSKYTKKNILLIAFTGVAALNIGGQTIHSFFRFPLKPLMPNDPDITIFPQHSQKRKILEQTDTIIIDEVSMLRADILEGLDYSLRMNGGDPEKLFGGKQILFVGDIFQLPPVIDSTEEVERELFKLVYDSEFFFDSISYKKLRPKIIEFSKIHRQSDDDFIYLLNKIRDFSLNQNELVKLNSRYDPEYMPLVGDYTITLTPSNYRAKNENYSKLSTLAYKSHFFKATIIGDFKEDRYPTDSILELRRDSQVILIKNDSINNGRRWVNGTLAIIEFIDETKIEIKLKDGSIHVLQQEMWENRRYEWNSNKGRITSKIIGQFQQFPLKLAWAITIHKSQGLTFDKVIIDLGTGTFVSGQLYTALSRCRSFDGIFLKRKVKASDIIADERLLNFHNHNILNLGYKADFKNQESQGNTYKNSSENIIKTIWNRFTKKSSNGT